MTDDQPLTPGYKLVDEHSPANATRLSRDSGFTAKVDTGRFPVSGIGSTGFAAPTSSARMDRGVPPLPCPSLDSPFLRMRKRRFRSLDFCWSSKICFTAREAMFIAATWSAVS